MLQVMTEVDSRQPRPAAPPGVEDVAWTRAAEPAPRPAERPSSIPRVFGTLSMIFALLMLCAGLLQSCAWVAAASVGKKVSAMERDKGTAGEGQAKDAAEFKGKLKGFKKVGLGHIVSIYQGLGSQGLILIVMSVVLLVVGVGQRRRRRWAARWAIYWSWAAFAAMAGIVALSFLVVGPAYLRFFEAQVAAQQQMPVHFSSGLNLIFGGSFGVTYILLLAPYPILTLLLFNRAKVRRAMTR
jgi:hypothetical protein